MHRLRHQWHFLNAYWKSCSVSVFSTACDSASITSFVSKWWSFTFIFDLGNRKIGWVGDDSYVVSLQSFLLKNEVWDDALSWCKCQFFCRQISWRSLRTFPRSRRKNITVVCGFDCLACQSEFLVNKPLMSKKMMIMLLILVFICLAIFCLTEFGLSLYGSCSRLSNHCQDFRRTFSDICTKSDAVPLLDPSRNRIKRLQIKGRKKSARRPVSVKCLHWLPRYASTNICRCIVTASSA
jgi:hypothetical protein